MRISLKYILLILLCSTSAIDSEIVAQNNTQREEVQRYFGYEILPFRYLSLPYDVSVNANERGTFVDISCIYFIFLPLFLIAYLFRWRLLAGLFLLSNLFIWIIGTSNSYVFSTRKNGILNKGDNMVDYLLGSIDFAAEKTAHITAYLYYVSGFVYRHLLSLITPVSGDADYITYPILVLLFLGGTFVLSKILKGHNLVIKAVAIVYWSFLFFWFKYSAGIPWYGYLLFFLSLMMMLLLMERGDKRLKIYNIFLKYAFFSTVFIYIIGAMAFRISDVNSGLPKKRLGTTMFSPQFFSYQLGRQSDEEILSAFYPHFIEALDQINNDPSSYILRIGTSFSYFIDNNSSRIVMDNQLGIFGRITNMYNGDPETITDVLKASNIKYIIIDVNTPYIDKTPEQSLKKKYDKLMKYLHKNPRLKLLCTNRSFRQRNPENGKTGVVYQMFPVHGLGSKIYYGGQYAIYEVL